MNKSAYLRRIARIKAGYCERTIQFLLPGGETRGIARNRILQVFVAAIVGDETPETEIMCSAIADSSRSRLPELIRAIRD